MPRTSSKSKTRPSPKATAPQRKTIGRVMHEYAHSELKSGRGGKAGKVKNRRQAIAIALHEAGASKYDSPQERHRSYAKTKQKEAKGETYQQEKEGKSHVGARGRRESSPAMGGENATTPARHGKPERKPRSGKSSRSGSRRSRSAGTRKNTRSSATGTRRRQTGKKSGTKARTSRR